MPIFPRNPNKIIKRIVAAGFSLSFSLSLPLPPSFPRALSRSVGGPAEGLEGLEPGSVGKGERGFGEERGHGTSPGSGVGESEKERKFYL